MIVPFNSQPDGCQGVRFQRSNLLAFNTKIFPLVFVLVGFVCATSAQEPKVNTTLGTIERKDPKFDALIPKDAKIEVLAGGFKWAEGPVWDKKTAALFFTDIPNNRVMRWSPKDGLTEFLKPSGYTGKAEFKGAEPGANGLAFDTAGNLILCQHGDRRIARLVPENKSFITLADKYMGKRFNSPNDLVYRKNGDLYFTDPPYGLPEQMKDPTKELDFQGVFRLNAKGEVCFSPRI